MASAASSGRLSLRSRLERTPESCGTTSPGWRPATTSSSTSAVVGSVYSTTAPPGSLAGYRACEIHLKETRSYAYRLVASLVSARARQHELHRRLAACVCRVFGDSYQYSWPYV